MSIEHVLDWWCLWFAEAAREKELDPTRQGWGTLVYPCSPGRNATPAEESAADADEYVRGGISAEADVYLIDGVVRAKCLRALVATGRPMTVFIHDTQRDWYDDAITEAVAAGFQRTDYPEGEDYPGCLLTKLEKR